MKYITRTVWILSFISLFTDVASEMLYPVIPVYLREVGFSVLLIGLLEGLAEALTGLSKGYFGRWSDRSGRRVPFVQLGYLLSAIARPLMAVFTLPLWVFMSRSLDRLGKGIRTASRDAILSDEATPETKGKVFGFHRALDTTGAFIGPLLALLYLYFFPAQYKTLFFIAIVPGALSVLLSLFLREKNKPEPKVHARRGSFFSFAHYWNRSPAKYRKLVGGLLIFALFNSSDMFLLLMLKQAGLRDTLVIGAFIFYNFIYALFAFPLGILADRIGLKKVFVLGLGIFALVYFGMAMVTGIYGFAILFFLYGIYSAATEGIGKAWISNISAKSDTASAIGTYAGFQSICTLIASTLAGLIWTGYGPKATFLLTASVAVLLMIYFMVNTREPGMEAPDEEEQTFRGLE